MNGPSRWDLLIELFDEASNLPVQEQQRFLERRTPDVSLRQEVQSLLKVSVPANDIIERCAYEWYVQPDVGQVSTPPPRLAAGEILAGRFKITTFLGRGGMGEVFAALDMELRENVALKLLQAELATQPAFVERFRREIRLARSISHINVARVFDLVQDGAHPLGPFIFYVMELLPGESLANKLKRAGPLPPGEALEIARQMASGLSAAHQVGVIHRDFKPANVMLHEGRAVITDFGLATALERSVGGGTAITTSLLLGTPGYMAPEQWTGKGSSVASDVYAFGVVMHEMVCGKHPNVAELESPEAWKKVITKCMEMEPRNRWRTPIEAVAALEPRFWNRRNWLSVAAASAGVVSLGTAGLRLYFRTAKPSRGFSMVVPDVENATGELRLDGIGTALRAQLDQSTYFNVVQPHALAGTLRAMMVPGERPITSQQYREAAWRMNAGGVVFGTMAYLGGSPTLTIAIEFRGSGPQTPSDRETRTFALASIVDLSSTVRAAANWIRETAGDASQREAQYDRLPEDVTTPSWEALVYYSKAEQFALRQRHDDALLQLDSALRVDPGFTLAATRRADILASAGRELQAIEAWRAVLRSLNSRKISRREELRALGMAAFDCGDYLEADRQFAEWASEYPADYAAYAFRATPLLMQDRAEELRRVLERGISCNPDFFTSHVQQALCAVYLGDRKLLDREGAELGRLDMPHFTLLTDSLFCFAHADFGGALRAARALRNTSILRFQHEAYLSEAMVFAAAGRMDYASKTLQSSLELPREAAANRWRSATLIGLAYCSRSNGSAYPSDLIEEAINLRASPTTRAHAAIVSSRHGKLLEAEKHMAAIAEMPSVPKVKFGQTLAQAEYLFAKGQFPASLEQRKRAAEFTAPFHASPQATVSAENLTAERRARNLVRAAALQWVDPFEPELGGWGQAVRATIVNGREAGPDCAKLRRFQNAMHELSNSQQRDEKGEII